jgi:hypothetical protein
MIESFSCGPVAFIENGIERFMKDNDGMMPAAVWCIQNIWSMFSGNSAASIQRRCD